MIGASAYIECSAKTQQVMKCYLDLRLYLWLSLQHVVNVHYQDYSHVPFPNVAECEGCV